MSTERTVPAGHVEAGDIVGIGAYQYRVTDVRRVGDTVVIGRQRILKSGSTGRETVNAHRVQQLFRDYTRRAS